MFSIGDRVKLIETSPVTNSEGLLLHATYTVLNVSRDDSLQVTQRGKWILPTRFEKVIEATLPPAPRAFRVGDKVRVKDGAGYQRLIPNGSIHLVTKVSTTWDGKTGLGFIIDGNEREFYSSRFELIEEPVLDDSPIKVGDTVYLTDPSKTSQQWLDHEHIVPGIGYIVNFARGNSISLGDSPLVHCIDAFSRRPSGKVVEPVKPVAMIPVQDVLDMLIKIGDPKLLDPVDMSMKMSDLIDFLQAKL